MKIKVNNESYINTEKLTVITKDSIYDYITIYYAPESKQFFKCLPAGSMSEFDVVRQISEQEAYDFLIDNNTDAEFINKQIARYFPDWSPLEEII